MNLGATAFAPAGVGWSCAGGAFAAGAGGLGYGHDAAARFVEDQAVGGCVHMRLKIVFV